MNEKDLYSVLGVDKNATPDDLKRAKKYLSKKLHPDVAGSENQEAFTTMQIAFSTLIDPRKRLIYDETGKIPLTDAERMAQEATGLFMGFLEEALTKAEMTPRKTDVMQVIDSMIKRTVVNIHDGIKSEGYNLKRDQRRMKRVIRAKTNSDRPNLVLNYYTAKIAKTAAAIEELNFKLKLLGEVTIIASEYMDREKDLNPDLSMVYGGSEDD